MKSIPYPARSYCPPPRVCPRCGVRGPLADFHCINGFGSAWPELGDSIRRCCRCGLVAPTRQFAHPGDALLGVLAG
jgi:hypothetical protein